MFPVPFHCDFFPSLTYYHRMYELMVESKFAAAHQLRGYKASARTSTATMAGDGGVTRERLNEQGLAIDFNDLRRRPAMCWTSSNTPS